MPDIMQQKSRKNKKRNQKTAVSCPYAVAELRQLQADIQAMDLFCPNDMVLISPEWGRIDVYFAEENKKSGAGLQKLEHSDAIVVLHIVEHNR